MEASTTVMTAIVIVAIVVGGVFALFKWFSVFNSPDGERYARMLAQGPFAPSEEEAQKPKEPAAPDRR